MRPGVGLFLLWRLRLAGLLLMGSPARSQLQDYQVFFGRATPTAELLVLRRWRHNGQLTYLTLDPQTLKTAVATLPGNAIGQMTGPALEAAARLTAYGRAMQVEQQRDGLLQDAGLDRADTTECGFSLTIDLCPSGKPLDRSVFRQLLRSVEPTEKPVPVTIAVTGLWMLDHPDDLAYLKKLATQGDLSITWVNHSYHHRFDPRLPLAGNFLLEGGTNLNGEVLLNEQAMLQNGLTPAVFFRFPGLVSDKAVFDRVLALGLLPIGSDAWLAKGQLPRRGSLVLIHANGNEPQGIADFMRLLRQHAAWIRHKTWLLYDLPKGLSQAFIR